METSTCPEGAPTSDAGEAAFVGEYDLVRVLGQGGMGIVYEARHLRSGHSVAIKILDRGLCVHPELIERFHREAEASRALTSPRTVRVYDLGTTEDGAPYIVMELLEGKDLARVADGRPVAVQDAVRWILEACEGVAEAHEHGIVHRDLKPGNLLLSASGIKVLDFGIAKHRTPRASAITLGTTAPLGTPEYMSPEQVLQPSEVDPRADVWSLGITLYELLTGRTPFCHENPVLCMRAILDDEPEDPRQLRPELDAALAAVVLRALAKDPRKRFQSVDAFGQALAHVSHATWSRTERRSHYPVFARTGTAQAAPRARRAGSGRPSSRARGLLLTAGFAMVAALFAAHWTHAASATETVMTPTVTAHHARVAPKVKKAIADARSAARLTTIRSRGLVAAGR